MILETAALQHTIEVERAGITRNVELLQDKARAMADWRAPIREHPGDALTIALIGGGILGLLSGGGRRRVIRGVTAAAISAREGRPAAPAHPVRSRVAGALVTLAVRVVRDMVDEVVSRGRSTRPSAADRGEVS